jgi:hypothetical protein
MKKVGRKMLLTPALQTRICKLLSQGSAIKSACIICGVGERTFYDWRAKGKAGEEPFGRFFSAVTRARETHKAKLIQIVMDAAHQDARHAEWLLERQFPSEFARTEPREKIVIERPPPVPPPEPQTTPRKTEKWFTPKGTGVPLDKKALDYLDRLRRAESRPRGENGAA